MAIKEIPTNVRVYYKRFIEHNKNKIADLNEVINTLEEEIEAKHNAIDSWKTIYKDEFGIDLDSFEEYKDNKYYTGKFFKTAKGLFINKQNDYELVADLFTLYDLAETQRLIHTHKETLAFCEKCIKIKLKDYTEILRSYYTEVHKKLILEGLGYVFSNNIGWICVNRCTFDRKKPILDYAATKKREKELIEKGERIYNKEEAEWCLRNGIEYNGKDKRVFKTNEYCYQIPLIDCKLPKGDSLKLEITDYRHRQYRGKTNEELIKLCNNDTSKICELAIDLKTKVTLCDIVDKLLYTKFIRNENQKPLTFTTTSR